MLRCVFFLILCQYSVNASALIYGKEIPSKTVSTVRISIQHEHFLRSIGKWQYYESKCSAVIVGTKPLTLLTAAHCLREVKVHDDTHLPAINIINPQHSGIRQPKITKAFYRTFEEVVEDVNLDIAVLVFDAQLDNDVKPMPVANSHRNETNPIFICGYGRGHLELELDNPRCDEKNYLPTVDDFSLVMPTHYKTKDEMLYIKSEAQFGYTQEITHASKSLIAINRINQQGNYDEKLPMLTEGDSGGAWLVREKNQALELIAISTLVERFYNKNAFWEFFDRDTPLSDFPYIAYGLKLYSKSVKDFLLFCKSSGADIKFGS